MQAADSNGLYDVHGDHLQTSWLLTDADTQQPVWRARLEVYGQATVNEDVNGNGTLVTFNFRFPGQYFDEETGLHYNYFRNYDPVVGRYVEADPIGIDGGLNVFLYANANPLKYVDPSGEWPDPDPCKCKKWLEKEKNTDWTKKLPACPCKYPGTGGNWGGEQENPTHHPGAAKCIRSKPNKAGAAQQCCYDKANNLITSGPGAGTPDKKAASYIWPFPHLREDVDPWYICGGWENYNKARPPNNANNCSKNPP